MSELLCTLTCWLSATSVGWTSSSTLVSAKLHDYKDVFGLTLVIDELSSHFVLILLTALILCFVFLAEYYEFDSGATTIAVTSAVFSQLAFVFFLT